jgi:putative transposase
VLLAVEIGREGFRDILGVGGRKEDLESYQQLLTHLKGRGLAGVQLIISDKCLALGPLSGRSGPLPKRSCPI